MPGQVAGRTVSFATIFAAELPTSADHPRRRPGHCGGRGRGPVIGQEIAADAGVHDAAPAAVVYIIMDDGGAGDLEPLLGDGALQTAGRLGFEVELLGHHPQVFRDRLRRRESLWAPGNGVQRSWGGPCGRRKMGLRGLRERQYPGNRPAVFCSVGRWRRRGRGQGRAGRPQEHLRVSSGLGHHYQVFQELGHHHGLEEAPPVLMIPDGVGGQGDVSQLAKGTLADGAWKHGRRCGWVLARVLKGSRMTCGFGHEKKI